jgi:hypothetical protein
MPIARCILPVACPLQHIKSKAVVSVTGTINERKGEAMKLITAILTAIPVSATLALASSGQEMVGASPLMLLFLGFGAFIVACQLIPSIMLFCAMLKGLFEGAAKGTIPKTGIKTL